MLVYYDMYGWGCICRHTHAPVSVLASSVFEEKNLFAAHHCLWAPMESFVSALRLTSGAPKLHIPAKLPSFFKGSGDSNSGPRACRVNALTTEPPPQLPTRFLFVFKSTNQRLS